MTTLVIGAAVSGRSAVELLREQGDKVRLYDADPSAVVDIEAEEVHSGEWDASLLDGVDLVVTSPGVPEHASPIQDTLRRGITLWSELELGYRNITAPVLAVTATNGKTTVTEVAAAMLAESGLDAVAVGNIGAPLSAVRGTFDVLVVEASSFQLRFVETFSARAGVLLNLAPDHLDWHRDFDDYARAKQRILERQGPEDVVVFDADDEGAVRAVRPATARRVPVSGLRRPEGGWGVDDGFLVVGEARVPLEAMRRSDPVIVVDIAAAAAAAMHLGATPAAVEAVARSYSPGRHRREVVGTWNGVTWVNDSKATNPHAALASIRSFPSVVLIAGGRAKGLDVAPLPLEPTVRHTVAIGEAAPSLLASGRATAAGDLHEAIAIADGLARPGDTVLLAPGCASFDMFRSYIDRGDRFAAAVRERKEG